MSDHEKLPEEGFVRIGAFLGPGRAIPLGRSTWYAGIKAGKFPAPVKIGACTFWRVSDIRRLIAGASVASQRNSAT